MARLDYTTLDNMSQVQGSTEPMPDPDCYIYLHHVNTMIVLPSYGEANNDSINVKFNSSTPLGRTAPIYSYANSGPRTLQLSLNLHRDMMYELNYSISQYSELIEQSRQTITNENTGKQESYVDYIDLLAKQIQAAALPVYSQASKMIDPPLVSLKLGNDIFIKGVVNGSVGVSYGLPILANKKYAQVAIQFSITEVIPYDATQVMKYGSYRGIDTSLSGKGTYVSGSSGVDLSSIYSGQRALLV